MTKTRMSRLICWPAALLAAAVVLLVAWARIVDDGDLPSGVLAGLAVSALLLLFATFVIEAMELRHFPAPPETTQFSV